MNWGKGIFIFYSLFVIAILWVVVFSFSVDVNLVSEDYYQQEIAYETQIERIKNTASLKNRPSVVLKKSFIELAFPLELTPKGVIYLFRPSDGLQDRRIAIALGANGTQQVDFSTQEAGKWIAKLTWSQDDKEYYQEFIIVK